MLEDYARKILSAHVYDVAHETPLDHLKKLSARINASVFLKREDLQPVFSFKLRGAYNKMANLPQDILERGVICASAGNHAQGVALAARKLNAKAVIVMPRTTPAIKVQAVKSLGGRVVLHGDAFDDAYTHAKQLEQEKELTFIHPYDDPDVIAGQGTIGMEVLHQCPEAVEAVFVPIGGGGLAAGVAAFIKFLNPEIKVIGVEPRDADSMRSAIEAGERVILPQVGLFADGVAVRQAGEETFRICRELLDDVIIVSTDAICAAVKDIFDDTRAMSEPSGALSLAGLKSYVADGKNGAGALIAINSGANVNFDRLRHIAERADIGEQREALLAVTIPEQPGSYRSFIEALGARSVTEFNYRYADSSKAMIFVGVQLSEGIHEKEQIIDQLRQEGYIVEDMSDNELAKLHVRYMVGGRVRGLKDEHIYRFQFPERPGALLRFLKGMAQGWNISLFHYRNHGADFGRVLAGLQVPERDIDRFRNFLEKLGYPYWDETDNIAYRSFLEG